MKIWSFLHVSTECITWSISAQPAYRSSSDILGLPGLAPHKIGEVKAANAQASVTFEILKECGTLNVPASLENPQSSYLWKHPSCVSLLHSGKYGKWQLVLVCYCRWGRPFKKPTYIMTNTTFLSELHSPCIHHGKKT